MVILAALPGMVRELLVIGNLAKPGEFSVSVNFLGYRIRKVGLACLSITSRPALGGTRPSRLISHLLASHSRRPEIGRVGLGGRPPKPPTDPDVQNSSIRFLISCRYQRGPGRSVNRVGVAMYLACFPTTVHETMPPSLPRVPQVGSPASAVL